MAVVALTTQEILTDLQTNAGLSNAFRLGGSQFTFSAAVSGTSWPTSYAAGSEPYSTAFSILSAAQTAAFRLAISLWDDLISPDFIEVVESAQNPSQRGEVRVAFTNTADVAPGAAAYAYSGTPSATPGGKVGDIWLNSNLVADTFARGSQGFEIFLHEIGHALGLKHSFDTPVVPDAYENSRYTLMSYTSAGYYVSFTGNSSGVRGSVTPVTTADPMVLDIAAVQAIYGAETTTRTGDNVYTFSESDVSIHSIYDAGGNDTLDLSSYVRASVIDLRPGGYSSMGYFSEADQKAAWKVQFSFASSFIDSVFANAAQSGDVYEFENNLGIAFSTVIENGYGGTGNDSIGGNSAANILRGNGGNDTIEGREGNDTIDGGAGTDIAVFSGNRANYTIAVEGQGFRVTDQRAGTNDGSDLVTGIEQLRFADQTVQTADVVTPRYFNLQALGLNAFGSDASAGSWLNNTVYPRVTGDVNGDGSEDIIGFGSDYTYVSLGNGNGTFRSAVVAINSFGASPIGGSWLDNDTYHREMGDVNGDGRDDIVGFGSDYTYVSLGQANGTFASPMIGINSFGASALGGGWGSDTTYPRMLGDVNGDGRDDIVGFGSDYTYVSFGQANGTFASPIIGINSFGASALGGGWGSNDTYPRMLGDVNGDGRDDIVAFGSDQVYVSLAKVGGTFASPVAVGSAFSVGAGWTNDTSFHRELADMNRDGRDDIVGFGANGTMVALSQPGGLSFATAIQVTDQFASSGPYASDNTAPRTLGDLNNDGYADIIGFGPSGVFTALNAADWGLL